MNDKVQIINSDDILVKYNSSTDKVYLELDKNNINLITTAERNKLQNIDENANNLYHNMITTTEASETISIDGENYLLPIGSKKAIHTYEEIKEAIGSNNDFINSEEKELINSLRGKNLNTFKYYLIPVVNSESLPINNIENGAICFVRNQKDIYFFNENNEWESLTNKIRETISLGNIQDEIDIILTDNNIINNLITRITATENGITQTVQNFSDDKANLESKIKQTASLISSTVSEFKYDYEDFFKVDLYGKLNPDSSIASSNNNKIYLNQSTGNYYKSNGSEWEELDTPNPVLFGNLSPDSNDFIYNAEDYNDCVYLKTGSDIKYYKSNGEVWNLMNIEYKIPIPTLFGCGLAKDFYDINYIKDDGNEYYSNHYRGFVNTINGDFNIAFYNNDLNKWEWIYIKTLKLLPETIKSNITQTANEIRQELSNQVNGLSSTISQTAGEINATIIDATGRISILEDTVDGLTSDTINSDEEIGSHFKQTAAAISTTVGEFKYNYNEDGFFKVDFYSNENLNSELASSNNNKIYLNQSTGNYYKSNGSEWYSIDFIIPTLKSEIPPTEININNETFLYNAEDYNNQYILISGGDIYQSDGTNWNILTNITYKYPIPILFGITQPETYYNPTNNNYHYKGYVNTSNGKFYLCYYNNNTSNWEWFYVKTLELLSDNMKSEINQTKDSINSIIQNSNNNKSEIEQKIDSINISVIQNKYDFSNNKFINVTYYSKDLENLSEEDLNDIVFVTNDIKLDQEEYKYYIYKNSEWIEFNPNNLGDINNPFYDPDNNIILTSLSEKIYPVPTMFYKTKPKLSKSPYKNIIDYYHNRTYVNTSTGGVYICKKNENTNLWEWVYINRKVSLINNIFKSDIKINSDNITSEVNRAKNIENELNSSIKQTSTNIFISVSEGKYDYDCNYEGTTSTSLFYSEYNAPTLFGQFGKPELDIQYPPSSLYLNKVYLNNDNGEYFLCRKNPLDNNEYEWISICSPGILQTFMSNNKPKFIKPSLFGSGDADIYYPNPDSNIELHYRTYINTDSNLLIACLKDSNNVFNWVPISHVEYLKNALESKINQTTESIDLIVNNAFTGSGSSFKLDSEKIKMAWNGISEYITFENGSINIKNSENVLINLSRYGLKSYNNNNNLLSKLDGTGFNIYSPVNENYPIMKLNSEGNKFYEVNNSSGYEIGLMGTTNMKQSNRGIELIVGLDNGKGYCNAYDDLKNIKGLSLKLNKTNGKYISMVYDNKEYFEFYPESIVRTLDNNDYSKKFVRRSGFTFYKDVSIYGQFYCANDKIYTLNFSGGNGNNAGFQNGFGELSIGGTSYTINNTDHPGVRLCTVNVNYLTDENGHWEYDNNGQRKFGTTNKCILDLYDDRVTCNKKIISSGSVTGTSFINSSDVRLKTNINDVNIEGLKTLSKIKLKSFNWILDNSYENIGIIAQQLKDIDPELVNIGENSILGINSSKIILYIIKAIQELMKKLNINFDNENIEEHLNDFTYEEKINFLKSIKYL